MMTMILRWVARADALAPILLLLIRFFNPTSSLLTDAALFQWEDDNTNHNLGGGQVGDRCGGLFRSGDSGDDCAEGLFCVQVPVLGGGGALFRGRCYPIECYAQAIDTFRTEFDLKGFYQKHIIPSSSSSVEALLEERSHAANDQAFSQSQTMKRIQAAMDQNPIPTTGLQRAMEECNHNNNPNNGNNKNANSTDTGNTLYVGFHMEGGILYDGQFSVFQILPGGNNNNNNNASTTSPPTILRGCICAGGIGAELSALIGIGFTNGYNPEQLQGCSTLVTDWELGLGLHGGISAGVYWDGIVYLDFNVGLGLGAEGAGVGICGNWPV